MRVALLVHGLPQPSTNGGPMTCWALMRHLLDEGHEATVVALAYPNDTWTHSPERQDLIRAQGADLELVLVGDAGPPGRSLVERIFPTASLVPATRAALVRARPDVAFVYHWDTLAATHGIAGIPRFGVVDDPWHLPNLRRWQSSRPRATRAYVRWTAGTLASTVRDPRAMVELLRGCEASGSFQSHVAEWLRAKGAGDCRYYAAPLPDPLAGGLLPERRAGGRPRILLGPSNLAATSTAAGLRLFATEILPRLERELGREGFEVHVVGEGEPPAELARLLPHPAIVLRGRVEPAGEEFAAADLQLVPTPFVLGKRVRIIVAFSYGLCVVAHTAEAVNLPELRHGDNALLADSGRGLADAVVRAVRDAGLRDRLAASARRTYEEHFAPAVAAGRLSDRLAELAGVARRAS